MPSVVVCGEVPELFFVFAYSVGDGFDGGAQGCDLVGESGQGAAGGGLVAVLVDDRAQGGVAIEGGAAQASGGGGGDGGEGDLLAVVPECGAGALDTVEDVGGGHPAWASLIRASSWAMSWQCRSASVIQPRFSASAASAAASTRWAARIGSELGSAWKLGQCSQMLA